MSEQTTRTAREAIMRQFGYLLNAFEAASQHDNPASQGYAKKRADLLAFVEDVAGDADLLRAATQRAERAEADSARLDWLEAAVRATAKSPHGSDVIVYGGPTGPMLCHGSWGMDPGGVMRSDHENSAPTLREAIDAGMSARRPSSPGEPSR